MALSDWIVDCSSAAVILNGDGGHDDTVLKTLGEI